MRFSRLWVGFLVFTLLVALAAFAVASHPAKASPPEQQIIQARGKLNYLRVHDAGGYGPQNDFIDAEVVFGFEGNPRRFGFQLRSNPLLYAHQGMLNLLLDAYSNNWTVVTDYRDNGGNNNIAFRVWLQK